MSSTRRRRFFFAVIALSAIALLLFYFSVGRMSHPSSSMAPTIEPSSDILVMWLSCRMKHPNRFNIVIFHSPGNQSELFVMRVIGLPGETVQLKNGKLIVNGKQLMLSKQLTSLYNFSKEEEFACTVPKESYFVLGDNIKRARDSRFYGPIPCVDIKGRVLFISKP